MWWKWIANIFTGGVLDKLLPGGVTGLIKIIWGDKSAQDQFKSEQDAALSQEQIAIQQSYEAEFSAPEKQFWFDRFVDGANRLVRPFFTYGIIALFVYSVIDPHEFSINMLALSAVPEMLWYIFLTIIAFWFGSRIIERMPDRAFSISGAAATKAIQVADQLQVERQYDKNMADSSKPLSNATIAEWNRRNNPGFASAPAPVLSPVSPSPTTSTPVDPGTYFKPGSGHRPQDSFQPH
jgi:hypothetical protein